MMRTAEEQRSYVESNHFQSEALFLCCCRCLRSVW